MKKRRDYIYADCMVPIISIEQIDELIRELCKPDAQDVDRLTVLFWVLSLLRRLQLAENLDLASDEAREVFEGMQHLGLYEGDAKL